jgi:hypothetical protein
MARSHRTSKPRPPKGTPTDLNLWVLDRLFGDRTRVSNQVEPTSAPHLRRCLRAGLLDVDGAELVLTDAGIAALAARKGRA